MSWSFEEGILVGMAVANRTLRLKILATIITDDLDEPRAREAFRQLAQERRPSISPARWGGELGRIQGADESFTDFFVATMAARCERQAAEKLRKNLTLDDAVAILRQRREQCEPEATTEPKEAS